jgi:serine protease
MRTFSAASALGARSSSLAFSALISLLFAASAAVLAPGDALAQADSSASSGPDKRQPLFEPTAIAGDPLTDPMDADLEESSWDIPGQIVVDARDDLDATGLAALASDFGFSFFPTRLEATTHIEIATVPVRDMASVLAKLRGDRRIENAEPLAREGAVCPE